VILSFLRFLAFTLLFIFIYRVVVGAFRYLTGDEKNRRMSAQPPPGEPKKTDAPLRDVKDAKFEDVSSDSKKPS
jgi:hypothetical protein